MKIKKMDRATYVTQMLWGQEYYTKYLHRMSKTASHYSLYKNAEHTVFEYAHRQNYRSLLTSIIGTITAANVIEIMIASRESWVLESYSKAEEKVFEGGCRTCRHAGLDDTGIRVKQNHKQEPGRKE